jgi:4-hydroxy-4-methyl-2-oxoglutarate aldolase
MSNLEEQIISCIERNRISSTEVADALGKSGVVEDMIAVNNAKHVTGKVKYIYAFSESNWPVHEQIKEIEEDFIVFVDAFNCDRKAIFGDLVAKYLVLYKRAKAIVVNGYLRDIPDLRKHNYPIWCTGFTPLGCYNRPVELTSELIKKVEARKEIFEAGILTCDDSGCTLIEKKFFNEDLLQKLDLIELQEDIWYYCIDTLKWSTFETICLKKYLVDSDVLPPVLRDRVKKIPFNG